MASRLWRCVHRGRQLLGGQQVVQAPEGNTGLRGLHVRTAQGAHQSHLTNKGDATMLGASLCAVLVCFDGTANRELLPLQAAFPLTL